ncbi:MAG: glycoside hydrolase [Synergistaceae bacterium]|nr:glycoside hydrolase [Synergistaceae bacterium]
MAAVAASFVILLCLTLPALSAVYDEPPEGAKVVPIERVVAGGKVNRTPYFAYVKVHSGDLADAWVPAELLADMKCPVKLSADKSFFTGRVENPASSLELPVLNTLLPNLPAIDLDFRAVSGDARYYFNITGMEAVTGVTSTMTDSRRVIVPPVSGDILVVGAPSMMPEKARVKIPDFVPPDLTAPFSLVWDHVTKHNPDISAEEILPTVKVISPTWFALAGDDGTISNKADRSYVTGAHAKGYEVWALVSNGFKRDRTTKFLASQSMQNQFIARMLVYARLYGVDGINIDFENVADGDATRFTAFVKKFSEALHAAGLKASVDLPIPTTWNNAYERAYLGALVDYVAVMTYDEHWGSSPRSGSTASLPWVSAGLQKTIQQIPAEKLLMGVPFYTREWAETKSKNGRVSVKAKTMAMASVDARLDETGATLRWLGDKGQNYFQFVSEDKTYRIWVEDERSIALRLGLVKKFKVAGAAFWRKGFEKPEIWPVIKEALAADEN